MKYLITILIFIYSCTKDQHNCVINGTGLFYVDNQSSDTADFTLIQESDTIHEQVFPNTKTKHIIKAGQDIQAWAYLSDTLYCKTRDGWEIQRCAFDGYLIR